MKQGVLGIQQRHSKIIAILEQEKQAFVSDLSRRLGVSDITTRRDLDRLEENGLIERFHGGAKLIFREFEEDDISYDMKGLSNPKQKRAIAQIAAGLITDGDVLFINAGTTTLSFIQEIKDMNVLIITNNAPASMILANGQAQLISTGGEYNKKNRSYTGELAANLLNMMYSDKCILGVNGINNLEGITTYRYLETRINDQMIKRCKGKVIVLADGSKVGKTCSFQSANITAIDILITDSTADPQELDSIRSKGIQVIIAESEEQD